VQRLSLDTINQNIKSLRKLERISSQREFGKIIGVPSHNINKYENSVIPKPEILRAIALKFHINLHLFITKEITPENYDEFKIERNTEAKLESIINESSNQFKIKRGDIDRVSTFFGDKLTKVEVGDLNDVDRKRIFGDLKSIFMAFNLKLKEF